MNKASRALLLLASMFSLLLPIAAAQAQAEKNPVGRWFADGYGFAIDFYVEPSSDTSHPVIGLVHAPAGGRVVCPQNMPVLVERICEKADKDGPFAIEGELRSASQPGQFVALYEGAFRAEWLGQDFPIRLAFFANELGRLQHLGTRRGRELSTSVNVTRTDEKPSPTAQWAEGNWLADFGTLRLEAAISADGPASFNGTLQAVPSQGRGQSFPGSMLSNFQKVAEDHYPFAMGMSAQLSGSGSLYEGTAATSADYTEIGQTARIKMLPFDDIAIVARIENLDGATFSDAFVFTPLDSPLTPVPPPGGNNQSAEEGEADPTMADAQKTGPAGEWRMVGHPHYAVPHLRVWRPEDTANGWVAIPSTIRIESDGNGFVARQPGWAFNVEEQADKANLQRFLANTMPGTGNGALDEWIGSPDDWLYSRHRAGGQDAELVFIVSGDRALLLNSTGFRGLYDFFILGTLPQNMFVAAFEREASGNAASSETSARENDASGRDGNRTISLEDLGTPIKPPIPYGSNAGERGAQALVRTADLNDACAALMAIESGLWSDAADGTVSLADLRVLARIMYANGVRETGMTNQAECANVIIIMQAAMN